jgi:uncharacterized protein (TIGR02246 family)
MAADDIQGSAAAQIRALVERRVRAIRTKDIEGVVALYARDAVLYDLVAPLRHRGADAVRRRFGEWSSGFDGGIDYEVAELAIAAGGDVAFSSSLEHVHARHKAGHTIDMWIRVTAGYRQVDGGWRIVHEHVSVPFDMQTMHAALDARP